MFLECGHDSKAQFIDASAKVYDVSIYDSTKFIDICAVFPIQIWFFTQFGTNASTFFKLFSPLLEIRWLKCCFYVCCVERISSSCVSVFILQIVGRV